MVTSACKFNRSRRRFNERKQNEVGEGKEETEMSYLSDASCITLHLSKLLADLELLH